VIDFSYHRARNLTWIVGTIGALAVLPLRGLRDAAGFAVGAAVSWVSLHSWGQLAETLSGESKRSVSVWAVFLALRYLAIGAVVYGTVKVAGSSPVVTVVGLLVSFAALLLELLVGNLWKSSR
jgi:hypothetical protein